MAKKKVRLDDDDFEEDLESEERAADESVDEPEEPSAPKGRNTGLTLVLCLLNVAAALGFTYLLVLDFQKRQEWSYAVFMNDFFIEGLPLKEEDDGPSASRLTMPRQKLDSRQISEVFSLRGGKGGGEFWSVDEPFPHRIKAKHLSTEILKDYFGTQGEEVATLEDEVRRLKDKVPTDIAKAGKDTVAAFKGKDDAAKRQFLGKLLLPLGYDIYQVDALDKKIKDAKGFQLDTLLDEAVQRRLLFDILAPLEVFRPADVTRPLIEKIGALDVLKLSDLRTLLQKRFDAAIADKFDGTVHQGKEWDGEARTSWEKRQTIGFLLVAIASLQRPDMTQPERMVPMYWDPPAPPGTPNLLRAQTVLGLYEFAAAVQNLPLAWRALEERVVQSINVDRQGFDITVKDKDGKDRLTRNEAFIDKHASEIRRIQDLTLEIKKAENRLKDLQEQDKTAKKIFEDRTEYLAAITKKLIAARVETARQVGELRELQQQLYRAQVELRDAAERNFRLEESIREGERALRDGALPNGALRGTKGTKKP